MSCQAFESRPDVALLWGSGVIMECAVGLVPARVLCEREEQAAPAPGNWWAPGYIMWYWSEMYNPFKNQCRAQCMGASQWKTDEPHLFLITILAAGQCSARCVADSGVLYMCVLWVGRPVSSVQHERGLPGPRWKGPGARGRDGGMSEVQCFTPEAFLHACCAH